MMNLPLKYNYKSSSKTLEMANALSGGLFLAITTIHIMPESVEIYRNNFLRSGGNKSKFD